MTKNPLKFFLAHRQNAVAASIFGAILDQDHPLERAQVAVLRTALGPEPEARAEEIGRMFADAPTTIEEILNFPQLAEAKIALRRGIAPEREQKGAAMGWFCFNRLGSDSGPSNRVGFFKGFDQAWRPPISQPIWLEPKTSPTTG